MITYVIIIIAIALIFDFVNGMNDAANSIATVVATRVLSPRLAVLWAAFFNFVAAFGFETRVAKTIGKGLIDPAVIDPNLILATLLGAILWTVVCTIKALPISVSHALIGAFAGAGLAKAGLAALLGSKLVLVAIFIVLSPIIGLIVSSILMIVSMWIFRRKSPRKMDGLFRVLQLLSSALFSLSHGLNDAQKTMGIISAVLMSVPTLQHYAVRGGDLQSEELAWWIILSCHAMIALGTYTGGWRVVKTLGQRVTKLKPFGGFCAESGGGTTLLVLSQFGIPVSTTHTITGAIFGTGLVHRASAIRWSVGLEILRAWILTLPAAAAVAAGSYYVISAITG